MIKSPLTVSLIGINVIMYLQLEILTKYLNPYLLFSPSKINNLIDLKNLFIFIIPQINHFYTYHLLLNMLDFYQIGTLLEYILRYKNYLKLIFLIALISKLIHFMIAIIFLNFFNYQDIYYGYSIGFSGINFGLHYYYNHFNNDTLIFFNQLLTRRQYIICILIFIQVIFPNASFIGHLSGLLAGIIVSNYENILFN